MPSDGDDDLLRIMAEIERGRREIREQYYRQQLLVDAVAAAFLLLMGAIFLQGSIR